MVDEFFDDPELLAEFVNESLDLLDGVSDNLTDLEGHPQDSKDLLNAVFRGLHSIKGNSSFFGLTAIQNLAHRLETVLDELRSGKRPLCAEVHPLLVDGTDLVGRMIAAVSGRGPTPEEAETDAIITRIERLEAPQGDIETRLADLCAAARSWLPDLPQDRQDTLTALLDMVTPDAPQAEAPGTESNEVTDGAFEEFSMDAASAAAAAANAQDEAKQDTSTDTERRQRTDTSSTQRKEVGDQRTMRIAEDRIDAFLNYVGDLVVVGDMFHHLLLQAQSASVPRDLIQGLGQVTGTFQALSGKLQQAIMSVRRVAARQLLRKVPKLVRDVASSRGKQIEVAIDGEKLEIDKSYVELLDAPLVHMVRNAADHGIESPERRREAGKPESGTISVSLEHLTDSIVLRIEDDGAGIDLERVAAKAREVGAIDANQALDQQAILDCIFAAGVSTAESVSEISGRGVGMDVVRRAIEQAGGEIRIDTERGRGTSFTIELPAVVTTQIGMGYFVTCGGDAYILDLERVIETLHCVGERLTRTPDGQLLMVQRNGTMPTLNLPEILGMRGVPADIGVTVEYKGTNYVLLVESVIGIKQMVRVDLDLPGEHRHPFRGVALQGDGGVALLLDIDSLLMLESGTNIDSLPTQKNNNEDDEATGRYPQKS